MSRYDLLSLQGKAKRDPEGYRDDVLMQLQHYNALHGLFMLKPGKDFKAFADLTTFLAQVAKSYPRDMPEFHRPIIELLDTHYALLEPSLRRSLTSALILLHNRGACALGDLLPLFFKMFRCEDKPLRALVFAHVVAADLEDLRTPAICGGEPHVHPERSASTDPVDPGFLDCVGHHDSTHFEGAQDLP